MGRSARDQVWVGESGGILLLFLMAVLVGLLAGLGAQHFAQDIGRPVGLHRGSVPKEITDLGYESADAFNADHARERAVIDKLLVGPVGSQALWENPETGNRGVVWVAKQTAQPDGSLCRDLIRHTLLNNAYRNSAGTTCRRANGGYSAEIGWHAE